MIIAKQITDIDPLEVYPYENDRIKKLLYKIQKFNKQYKVSLPYEVEKLQLDFLVDFFKNFENKIKEKNNEIYYFDKEEDNFMENFFIENYFDDFFEIIKDKFSFDKIEELKEFGLKYNKIPVRLKSFFKKNKTEIKSILVGMYNSIVYNQNEKSYGITTKIYSIIEEEK